MDPPTTKHPGSKLAIALVPPKPQLDGFVARVRDVSRRLGMQCVYFFPIYDAALAGSAPANELRLDVVRRSYVNAVSSAVRSSVGESANKSRSSRVIAEWTSDAWARLKELSEQHDAGMVFLPMDIVAGSASRQRVESCQRVLDELRTPCWLVSQPATTERNNVLVTVGDGTPRDDKIFDFGEYVASASGGDVHLLDLFEIQGTFVRTLLQRLPGDLDSIAEENAQTASNRHIRPVAERYCVPPERVHVRKGPASSAIATLVEPMNIDAVVMAPPDRRSDPGLSADQSLRECLAEMKTDVVLVALDKPAGQSGSAL